MSGLVSRINVIQFERERALQLISIEDVALHYINAGLHLFKGAHRLSRMVRVALCTLILRKAKKSSANVRGERNNLQRFPSSADWVCSSESRSTSIMWPTRRLQSSAMRLYLHRPPMLPYVVKGVPCSGSRKYRSIVAAFNAQKRLQDCDRGRKY